MLARVVLLLAAAGALAGCGGGARADDGRTRVVAAFYPLAYAAERVGGPGVDVVNLTPPGAEPHDLELSIRDVERVRDADLVLYLGGFQPALERALAHTDGRTLDLLEGMDGGAGEPDPHLWLDPVRFGRLAERIAGALDTPPGVDELARDLRALDLEYERGLADCDRRELVTSHAAFGYLADRYDLEQIAITGRAPEAEPSAGDLERVVDEIRARGTTTVFSEPLASSRLAETVARETGATTAVLDPIEGLSEEQIARGESYLSVMRRNLDTLRGALGCR